MHVPIRHVIAKRGNLVAILSDFAYRRGITTRLPRRPDALLPVLLLNDITFNGWIMHVPIYLPAMRWMFKNDVV
ncbi:hypothetical protein ABIC45_004577 [Mucilaginibacter rubeus]